jgi:hypothetical protein
MINPICPRKYTHHPTMTIGAAQNWWPVSYTIVSVDADSDGLSDTFANRYQTTHINTPEDNRKIFGRNTRYPVNEISIRYSNFPKSRDSWGVNTCMPTEPAIHNALWSDHTEMYFWIKRRLQQARWKPGWPMWRVAGPGSYSKRIDQCFSTAGRGPGTGPWH